MGGVRWWCGGWFGRGTQMGARRLSVSRLFPARGKNNTEGVSLFTPPPFETGVCDRLAARCGIRAASRDRGPCPPCPDAPPTAPRSRLRVRPADRLSLPPAKPVRAASSCLTRRPCGVEATPLDAVWHGKRHGRARTAQPRRLEERRARTGDTGCASSPPARCAARYRTSAGTVHVDRLTG